MAEGNRAFTLVEGLFAMLITSMVLGGLMVVLSQASRVRGDSKDFGDTLEVSHAFNLIRNDLASAVRVIRPTGTGDSRLELMRMDPRRDFASRAADGQPHESAEQIRVEYRLEDGFLTRSAFAPSNALLSKSRLLECRDLRCGRTLTLVEVSFTLEHERVSQTHTLKVRVRQ